MQAKGLGQPSLVCEALREAQQAPGLWLRGLPLQVPEVLPGEEELQERALGKGPWRPEVYYTD
eukprot:5667700-Lingulodinium_polyedra.AAC.1